MLSNRYKKRISLFLLTNLVGNILVPSVTYALTVGAAAPEYTSFEPVDATSLVNPATGSFTYNLPLIEVPGPEGGYPLALFNHAGIGPDQEASWTGLGWNLNPGAINRVVNGIPDDYAGQESSVRDQWSGGTTYNGQATFPLAPGITETIAGSWDTYQGFGIDYMKTTGGIPGTPLSASLDSKGNLGLTAGYKFGPLSLSKENSLNIRSGKFNSSLDASLSTNNFGVGVSLSSAGGLKTFSTLPSVGLGQPVNNSFGKISTETKNIFNVGFAKLDRTQYWMDQSQATPQYGILNAGKTVETNYSTDKFGVTHSSQLIPSNYGFDKYVLPEITPAAGQSTISLPEAGAGPSFPAYDIYSISGQGTGGSMQPYTLENFTLFDQAKSNLSYYNDQGRNYTFNISSAKSKLPNVNRRLGFRLNGDFSNAHIITNPLNVTLSGSNTTYPINSTPNQLGYTPSGVTSDGYNSGSLQLAGSNHVEYFTNREISSGAAAQRGFVNAARTVNRTSVQGYDIQDLIGGFAITKPDGITYHYALPVYTYDSHQYSINTQRGTMQRDVYNIKPYAYTWLLTAITGPDYVDQNTNGIVDDPDFGYWTGFTYGKWTDTYQFRHPDGENEFLTDVNGTKFHSEGRKQLYYLDAIYTRSHTALFVKSIKQDGLGIASLTKGGFGTITEADGTVKVSTPTLELDEVVLVRNESLKVSSLYNTAPAGIDRLCALSTGGSLRNANVTTDGSQLLTAEDMALNNLPDAKVLKKARLTYDYSLCPRTLNSLGMSFTTNPATVQTGPGGKLSLKAVQTFGQGNVSLIPATRFEYDAAPLFTTVKTNTLQVGGIANVANVTFADNTVAIGDIITFSYLGVSYYAVLTKAAGPPQSFDITFLNGQMLPGTAVGANPIACQTTKNPPYVKKAYDSWNLFKSDYIDFTKGQYNNDISRITSEISARGVDVWSLRKVITPLGSTIAIGYESGTYNQVGVQNPRILNIYTKIGCYFAAANLPTGSTPVNNPAGYTYKEYSSFNGETVPYADGNRTAAFFKLYLEEQNVRYLLQQNFKPGDLVHLHSSITQYGAYQTAIVNQRDYSEGSIKVEGLGDNYLLISDPYQVLMAQNGGASFKHYQSYVELPLAARYGGIRTNSIAIEDASGQVWKTTYEYVNGVTAYEPLGYDGLIYDPTTTSQLVSGPLAEYHNILFYKNSYRNLFINLMALAPELPDPGIIYSTVRKRQFVGTQTAPSFEQYEFTTFNPDMVKATETKNVNAGTGQVFASQARTIRLENRTALLGQLQRFSLYDNNNNLLRETRNEFTTNANEFAGQGQFEQLFSEMRTILPKDEQGNNLPYISIGTVSIRAQYPAILRNTTTVDYKTGIQKTSQTKGYDFLSGEPTSQLASDGYGNQFLMESTPAYRYYTGITNRPTLGPKFTSTANRQMLTQEGSSYMYKVDANGNKLGVVAAQAQSWDDNLDIKGTNTGDPEILAKQAGIWRKSGNYAWLPTGSTSDGLTPTANSGMPNQFTAFNFQTQSPATPWKRVQQNTLYSVYSTPLESSDMNGVFNAQKLGNKGSKLLVSGAPANYEELAYTGAEEELWPNGSFTGGVWPNYATWMTDAGYRYTDVPSSGKVHTGTHSVAVPTARNGIEYEPNVAKLDPAKAYRASVWTTSPQAGIYYVIDNTGVTIPGKVERAINGWYLLTIDIPPIGTGHTYMRVGVWNSTSQTLYADDFRFQPANAQVNSYVYDEETGRLTDILDNNNLATHYEYDAIGRLIKVYKESFQYGRQLTSEKHFNLARNQKFIIQASLGGGGQLNSSLPGGLTNQLELGSEVRYVVSTINCQDKFEVTAANAVVVDGVNISTSKRLADGTFIRLLADGCLLSNVRATHTVTINTQHYNYPSAGTQYDMGCEQDDCGGLTGYMIYKTADGCGGLLPTADGQYYRKYSSSCRQSNLASSTKALPNRPLPPPCATAAKTQSFSKKLQQAKAKAAEFQPVKNYLGNPQ